MSHELTAPMFTIIGQSNNCISGDTKPTPFESEFRVDAKVQ